MLTNLYVRGQMLLDDLKNDQRGVTAIEYAIVAVAIAVIVAAVFSDDSGGLKEALNTAIGKIKLVNFLSSF